MGDVFDSFQPNQREFDPTEAGTSPFTDPLSVITDPFNAGGLPNPGQAKDLLGKGGDDGAAAAAAANAASVREIEELRRQFNISQENIQPFLTAGSAFLPFQQSGTTIEGFNQNIGDVLGSDAFQSLARDRGLEVQGQNAALGQTRSGAGVQAAAAVPQNLALELEQLLTGRGTELTGSAQNAALGLGSLGAQNSQAIAGSINTQGQNTASGILADQQAQAAAQQGALSTGAAAASIFFSDPRLKENVEKISEIQNLNVYQWDWIEGTENTIIDACQTIGFMADEVEEKYPHHVSEFGGYKIIHYEDLLKELDRKVH